MKKNNRISLLIALLVIAFTLLACKTLMPGQALPSATTYVVQTQPAKATATSVTQPIKPTNTPTPALAKPSPTSKTESNSPTATQKSQGSTAGKLEVSAITSYKDSYNNWNIFGLVKNSTQQKYGYIEVHADLLDAAGKTVYTETQSIPFNLLAPGETSPFSLYVSEPLTGVVKVNVTVIQPDTTDMERAAIEISEQNLIVGDDGELHYIGQLKNTGDKTADINTVDVGIFDKDKNLIYVDTQDVVLRQIEPGQSGPFRISVYLPEGYKDKVGSYNLYVDATTALSPSTQYDVSISSQVNKYKDSVGGFYLAGEVTNKSKEWLSISLLATAKDADGKVIDASNTNLALYSLAPGEALPFVFTYWGPMQSAESAYAKAVSFDIQVDWNFSWPVDIRTVDIKTEDNAPTQSGAIVEFTGKIRNNTDAAVKGATVIISAYDKTTAKLYTMGYQASYAEIAAGGTADYSVYIYLPDGMDLKNLDYKIAAKGEKP